MKYNVVKAFNHNVVLVSVPNSKDQMVIMAKGIGFGKRPGDIVTDDQQENQIFKSYNGNETYPDVPYQEEEMEQLVGDIVVMASKRLALDRKAVYHRLLDHIIFAVDRMNFGLPIENPFLEEIATFYPKELEIARIAINMLNDRFSLKLNEDEAGFIALSLHSSRKQKSMSAIMNRMQIFSGAVDLLTQEIGQDFDPKCFFLQLDSLLRAVKKGVPIKLGCAQDIEKSLSDSFSIAKKICRLLESQTGYQLGYDCTAYLAVEIEKIKTIDCYDSER